MNKLALLASLAVAASAAAADLKDPAQVLHDWDNTVAQTREPALPAQTLADQSARLQSRQRDLIPRPLPTPARAAHAFPAA